MVFDDTVDHRFNGTETMQKDTFIVSNNGGKRQRDTTKGWEIQIKWKYGSTTSESMKYLKECYPLKLDEYYHQTRISQEPTFPWWVPHVMKKRDRIISKVKLKYWTLNHKYGVRTPKSVKDTIALDKSNGNTL